MRKLYLWKLITENWLVYQPKVSVDFKSKIFEFKLFSYTSIYCNEESLLPPLLFKLCLIFVDVILVLGYYCRMPTKMPSKPGCMSQCGCDSDNFLPICGSDGLNYFSPCHAGCSDGIVRVLSTNM